MITGTVNAHREAILRLAVFDASNNQFPSDAVVDTSFDGWISLPPAFVAALGLRWKRFGRALLADGSESLFDVYEAKVLWDGHARMVPVWPAQKRSTWQLVAYSGFVPAWNAVVANAAGLPGGYLRSTLHEAEICLFLMPPACPADTYAPR